MKKLEDIRSKIKIANNSDKSTAMEYYSEAIKKYEALSYKEKSQLFNDIYLPYRNMARYFFESHDYMLTIEYLEKAMKLPRFQYELLDNVVNINNFLYRSYLILGLEDSKEEYLQTARAYLDQNSEKIKIVSNTSLQNDFYVSKEIDKGICIGEIWTNIVFDLPFPIILDKNSIQFEYNDVKVILKIDLIQNSQLVQTDGFVQVLEDKYGRANKCKVYLSVNEYISPDKPQKVHSITDNECFSYIIYRTTEIMNFFIERYRVTTDEYWIETIPYKMIADYSCKITAGTQTIRDIIHADSSSIYQIQGSIPWLNQEKLDLLTSYLNNPVMNLWESLYLDSRNYFLIGKFREAIVSVNGALENFIACEVRNYLLKYRSSDEIDVFFEGKPNYEQFFLREYISEEDFERAVKSGVVKSMPPTTFAIIKKCYEIAPLGIGRNKVNSIISKIRNKRNDIVHGHEEVFINSKEVKEAINSFERFVEIIKVENA